MEVKDEQKRAFIHSLNKNFRTVLCYGNDSLTPIGEFVIKDFQLDAIPDEYKDMTNSNKIATILFTKVDDENSQIVVSVETFLTKIRHFAVGNANILLSKINLETLLQQIKDGELLNSKIGENLKYLRTISLEDSDADYIINGKIQSPNYSICPIELGCIREKKLERTRDDDDFCR